MANALTSNSSIAFGDMGNKASNWASGGSYSNPNSFNFSAAIPGIGGLLQGFMGDSGAPYQAAGDAYQQIIDKYLPGIQQNLNPFITAGQNALPQWQNALNRMQNPTDFMKEIFGTYQESPAAAFERKYGQEGITNAASASGMLGSGALMKSAADYNQALTSRDMQQFLQNALGINQQYMGGLQGLSGMGLQGATSYGDILSHIIPGYASAMGGAAYGQNAGGQMDLGSMLSGGLSLAGMFF